MQVKIVSFSLAPGMPLGIFSYLFYHRRIIPPPLPPTKAFTVPVYARSEAPPRGTTQRPLLLLSRRRKRMVFGEKEGPASASNARTKEGKGRENVPFSPLPRHTRRAPNPASPAALHSVPSIHLRTIIVSSVTRTQKAGGGGRTLCCTLPEKALTHRGSAPGPRDGPASPVALLPVEVVRVMPGRRRGRR